MIAANPMVRIGYIAAVTKTYSTILMKKFLLLAILAVSAIASAKAQRCTITLNLTSQHEIDTLSAATKSCAIQGITISGSGIINLEGLSGIETISGSLYIRQNPDLLNLNGISGLKTVMDEIDINNNPLITNLDGLSSLTTVGYNVRVADNDALTTVSGLRNLTTIPGFLSIGRNKNLLSFTGLEGITRIDGSVALGLNPLITNLDPFKNLTYIGGYLYVGRNPALTSIRGLSKLGEVWGYVNFEDNDALTTLAGLNQLAYGTPSFLKIVGNNSLSVCSVKSICDYVSRRISGEYLIQGNAEGCGSGDQIKTICATLPVKLTSFTGTNKREGNIMKWETAWEVNNAGFEVQKSRDSKSFDVLAFAPGNGRPKENGQYEYQDTAPYPTTYYRLKQMDYDGTYAYSKIVAVKDSYSSLRVNEEVVSIFPNPVKDKLTIQVKNLNQPFSIRNADGQIIQSGEIIPSKPIDVSHIANGLHLLTVGSETFKILISH